MDISAQIKELNSTVVCHIRPSPIHGIGVFALRNILKGERLHLIPNPTRTWYSIPFERLNELRPEIKQIILDRWPAIVNGSLFLNPNDEIWLTSWVNHSCKDFNYFQDTDCATRDIKKDEEILERYCGMPRYKEVFPWLECLC